jgi:hypothetical protein
MLDARCSTLDPKTPQASPLICKFAQGNGKIDKDEPPFAETGLCSRRQPLSVNPGWVDNCGERLHDLQARKAGLAHNVEAQDCGRGESSLWFFSLKKARTSNDKAV